MELKGNRRAADTLQPLPAILVEPPVRAAFLRPAAEEEDDDKNDDRQPRGSRWPR